MIIELLTIFAIATMFDLVVFSALFFAFMIGIHYDRREETTFKWAVLLVFLVYYLISFYSSISIQYTKESLFNFGFLFDFLKYIGIGVAYSLVEVYLFIQDASNKFAEATKKATCDYNRNIESSFKTIKSPFCDKTYGFIESSYDITTNKVTTNIKTSTLSSYIGSWVIFWPFYVIDLVVGRVFANMFNIIANAIKSITKNRIQKIFETKVNQ